MRYLQVVVAAGRACTSCRLAASRALAGVRERLHHQIDLALSVAQGWLAHLYRVSIHGTVATLKGVDLIVLLGLLRHPVGGWTVRSLAAELRLPSASVQRSLDRLAVVGVFDARRRRVNVGACEDLFVYALRFIAPAAVGGETRGLPTAWAAPPLVGHLARTDDLPPVWPDPHGEVRGLEVQPLHPRVVSLASADSEMYELLALIDGLRVGDARVRQLAVRMLHDWILGAPAVADRA